MPPLNHFGKTLLTLTISQMIATPAHTASFLVDSAQDDNGVGCTLREAIVSVNLANEQDGCVKSGDAFGVSDSIGFDPVEFDQASSHTITLIAAQGGQLSIAPEVSLTINGIGEANLTVHGGGENRVLYLHDSTLSVNNLTIAGGDASIGAGIYAKGASSLSLVNTTVSENSAELRGGGIAVQDTGYLSLTESTVSNNYRDGISLRNGCSASMRNSNVTDNNGSGIQIRGTNLIDTMQMLPAAHCYVTIENTLVTGNSYRGLSSYYGKVDVINSIFSQNLSEGISGLAGSSISISNSTIAGNSSTGVSALGRSAQSTGGLYPSVGSGLSMTNSTISGNAGHGISLYQSGVALTNSTVTNNISQSWGGGVSVGRFATLSIKNNIMSGNFAKRGAEVYLGYYASIISDNANIVGSNAKPLAEAILQSPFADGDVIGASDFNATYDGPSATSIASILNPLADNGCQQTAGRTSDAVCIQTHALAVNSLAIDAANISYCGAGTDVIIDQRGETRTEGRCDIGAFEGFVESVNEDPNQGNVETVLPLINGKTLIISL
ncbi:right-handed parallel beta-helix repeat-containing protein [Arenicella xantha]|uniref:Putative outer membrane repeat protein n=1 Tax=Arenicella xantha TaxID=644221 RepID=A0A395JS12_9GAMM|nr:right-handed parallel beta-helix repeat-containing protein [Arenicella xantha]RBP53122.1 putative outer membrane repeat protein [Arenicella xantha]